MFDEHPVKYLMINIINKFIELLYQVHLSFF